MLQPLRPTSASVDELLASCASRLAEKAPRSLQPEIDALRRHMTDRPSESDRARYCALITEHALLNDHAIGAAQRTDLHEVLLRLAFGAPLTYDSYCAVEAACSGIRGNPQPLPRHLAEIITERIGVDSVNLALLVLHGLDKQLLIDAMQALPHGELLAMAAAMTEDSRWLDGHAWAMCAIVTRYLTAEKPPTGQAGRDQLKTELRKYGFLAQALQKVSPDRCQYQLNVLEELLKAAYGRKLEQRDIREILLADKFAPTAALLAAVLRTAHPRHVKLAMWLFAGATLKEASFSYSAGDSLISLINTANDLGSDAHLQFNDRARRRSDRRARIASQQSQGQAESAVGIGPAPPRIRK